MADKFKFKLLTGTDPQAQYDAITTKDALTFYLLSTGIGYLGATPLFGGGTQNTIVMTSGTLTDPEAGKLYALDNVTYGSETLSGLYFYDGSTLSSFSDEMIATYLNKILVTDMTAEGYTGDDATIATTKAIMDMIGVKLSDSSLINAAFFRKVESHTLTDADLTNTAISLPTGAAAGDIGLLFTADTEGTDDGDEQYFFVSLTNYLTAVYGSEDTTSITMELTSDNKFKASLKIQADEESIKIDEVNGGVYLEKATTINDGDGTTDGGEAPSANKLVTEEALVNYVINSVLPAVDAAITEALKDVVTYTVDDGTSS